MNNGMREFVTGSDACTTDGAGPSNAVAGLASTLLGTASKSRHQMQEYASLGAQPSRQYVPPLLDVTPEATVHKLAGHGPAMPGLAPTLDPQFQEFNRIFNSQVSGANGSLQLHPQPNCPQTVPTELIHSTLHSFVRTGQMRVPFQPHPANMPQAPLQLSTPEEVKIRDRSTILSRHLFSEQGDSYADDQVGVLLHSLGINQAALPARIHDPSSMSWNDVWGRQNGVPPEESAMRAAHEHQNITSHNWADDFGKLSLSSGPGNGVTSHQQNLGLASAGGGVSGVSGASWMHEFERRQALPVAEQWVEDFSGVRSLPDAAPGQEWATDFTAVEGATTQWVEEFEETVGKDPQLAMGGGAAEHSRRIAEELSKDPGARFQNSKFMQFLSKMSQGELSFQDGKLVDQQTGDRPTDWAAQFEAQTAARDTGNDWAAQYSGLASASGDAEAWAADFQGVQEQQQIFEDAWTSVGHANSGIHDNTAIPATGLDTEYTFNPVNPYNGNSEALNIARTAFAQGSLTTAVLALEAVVKSDPGNAEAWRLLGTANAENDDDRQAIAAMARALKAAPNSLDVMLSLGVSHVNELHEGQAVGYLMRWLGEHPEHSRAIQGVMPSESSEALVHAQAAFTRASEASPEDADVLTALGVIMHLASNYHGAATAFENALKLRPADYSLWNKLGATLANSNRSEEAKSAYVQALRWKPNYMRAWTNMGISHSNLGQYMDAAKFYIKALTLNNSGHSVWTYLETALVLIGRADLIPAVEATDLDRLASEIGVA